MRSKIMREDIMRTDIMRTDMVVAVDGVGEDAWLQAADVIVGSHRTRRAGRRWVASIRRRFPGCVVAVARQRRDRWCLVGLPERTFLVRGGRVSTAVAVSVGCAAYHVWARRGGWS